MHSSVEDKIKMVEEFVRDRHARNYSAYGGTFSDSNMPDASFIEFFIRPENPFVTEIRVNTPNGPITFKIDSHDSENVGALFIAAGRGW